ncbi:hypothetical protein [Brevibacillus brevis]|uniref:Pyridoxamine 5'-phosphate oxidase putative domain-containing protein n=1 Tax=Brevibacillus brevis TaxID=1393 RepID=A0ABY9T522_BREBE|nr:hypothetical protein [Brevibacillus brevis]WNC15131.1 hypothetical protein RGB73_01775 [Brevibacillus brevis]
MGKPVEALSQDMVSLIQGSTIVLLNVVHRESERVYTTALSWVYAINERKIRFAIDAKSEFVSILERNPELVLAFIGLESVYSIVGKAAIKMRQTEGTTLKLAILEVDVQEVRDIIFYGGKVVTEPSFVKTYNAELAKKLDQEVKDIIYR